MRSLSAFRASARVRLLATLLALTVVGMVLAGVAVFAVQSARIDARIDDHIRQEVEEFARFQRSGIDPQTGEPFTTVPRLFEVALERNVPNEHESFLGYIDGRVAYYSDTRAGRQLVESRELTRAVRAVLGETESRSRFGEVDTDIGHVRFAVLPVDDGTDRGGWVVAYLTDRESAEFGDVVRTYVVVSLLALVVLAAAGWLVAGALLRPLRLLRRTARSISETDLGKRIEVTGADDISSLARTFNAMLDRIEQAFAAQRSFLDDAGHELRTPITVIRGHVELLDAQDPVEVEETRTLVLDEIDRMSRMVEELILLAKAERPDFVRATPVDLASLTDTLAERMRLLGERTFVVDSRADATVIADGQRLAQAMLQLAVNAVAATGPGDVVAIGTAVDPAASVARLWVRDTGNGIAPGDRQRVFHRFARGEGAAPGEGSGLGLSIVKAIAEAHGGRVELASAVGVGSTFTLALPCRITPTPAEAKAPVG